jgi:hypothetical protein
MVGAMRIASCIASAAIVLAPAMVYAQADLPPLPAPPEPPPSSAPPPLPPAKVITESAPPDGAASSDVEVPVHMPREPGYRLHDGFYLRISGGPAESVITGQGAVFAADGSLASSNADVSFSSLGGHGQLAIGGTPQDGIVLGGLLSIYGFSALGGAGGVPQYKIGGDSFGLDFFIDWFPDPRGGWHVGAAAGLGGTGITVGNVDNVTVCANGLLFGGYDWWIAPQWSFGFMLEGSANGKASVVPNDNGVTYPYDVAAYSLGLDLSFLYH